MGIGQGSVLSKGLFKAWFTLQTWLLSVTYECEQDPIEMLVNLELLNLTTAGNPVQLAMIHEEVFIQCCNS